VRPFGRLDGSVEGAPSLWSSEKNMRLVPKQSRFDTQTENNRGGERVNSRVPVIFEWEAPGRTFKIEGTTKDTSPRGCMVITPSHIAVRQKLKLINRINQKNCEAVVIWHKEDSQANWVLGLELQEPGPDFWGLDL